MKVASFFSGIGGFDLGFENVGMKVVFQCEKNKFCQKVLRKNFKNVEFHEDINTLNYKDIPEADLWCGGFPCQDLSLANQGKRKGLNGSRSGLFFKFYQLLSEQRPQWVIIENVPGLINSHSGEDFKVLLSSLDELGYCISWRILDAKYFGTPQRRRRVYIVGSYRKQSSIEILFDKNRNSIAPRQGLGQRDIIKQKTGRIIEETNLFSIQHSGIGRKHTAGPQAKGYRNDGETYTLDSRGSSDAVCQTNDTFRIRDSAGISKGVDSNRFRAIGNAVSVPVIEWIGKRIIESNYKIK